VSQTSDRYDPITIEIIQDSLGAITDEMFATIRKTAMSSIIHEVLDFGVAITDARGNLASSGNGIPPFAGMLDWAVRTNIRKHEGEGNIRPGEILLTNDPHQGGVSHMNDVALLLPVFDEGELIAWVANKAHWVDIGGMSPGSINPDATEIFQKGLQLPEVKLFENGEPIQPVFDIIKANSRLPDTTLGDLWAGVASMRAGEKRLLELVGKYGRDVFLFALENYLDYGEAVSLRALAALPTGTFEAEDYLDDGRKLVAKITLTDAEFIIDLRGDPPQDRGPFNNSYASSLVDAQVLFKGVTSPDPVANAGTFRPLKLVTDEGSMFNATYPAAMGLYYECGVRILDVMWQALAPHVPDRLTAGHYGSVCGTIGGGIHPETGKPHSFIEPEIGAGEPVRGRTATAASTPARMETRLTVRSRPTRPGTASTSTSTRSTMNPGATASTAAARAFIWTSAFEDETGGSRPCTRVASIPHGDFVAGATGATTIFKFAARTGPKNDTTVAPGSSSGPTT